MSKKPVMSVAPTDKKKKPVPAAVVAKAQPAAPSKPSAVGGLFSTKVASVAPTAKKSANGKPKPLEEIDKALIPETEVFISGKMILKLITKKIKKSEYYVKDWCLQRFAQNYARTGVRPKSFEVIGGNAKFEFIPTSRIYLNPERVQALRDLNIDVDSWTTIEGIVIDYEALQRHGLEAQLQKAIEGMNLSEAILGDVLKPKHVLKKGFFDAIYSICQNSLQKGEDLATKMHLALSKASGVGSVNQTKNPEIIDLTGETQTERMQAALKIVLDTEITTPDTGFEEQDDE
jgi:hypothetical protein